MAKTSVDLAEYTNLVESAAAEYAGRYRKYGFDREDMSQAAWVWMLQHKHKIAEWFEVDEQSGPRMLGRAVRNAMHDAGEDAKAQKLGYSREDLKFYRKGEIAALLDVVFDPESWLEKPTPDGGRSTPSDPATGGNWAAGLADVARAFEQLDAEDKELLLAFHRDDKSNNYMADQHEVSHQVMSYRHDRALKRMVKHLGGFAPARLHDEDCDHSTGQPWPSGRRAMSNAAARALTQTQYEDDEV
ncbi:hypothetical protein [Nocardioides massiliensis]|uniref:Sigma-70 family RNA polymerase sigma factor n=1 Tax=Nocardioides massiliensis TaxID=1325935 RepID=A0ABT9NJC2_9ACTN|nr:hypothetical protein [Nocardioides massiliensis]MDP9820521.1 hypothetical protein [Nocardioides massiliensis]